jgi:hypothetical protein
MGILDRLRGRKAKDPPARPAAASTEPATTEPATTDHAEQGGPVWLRADESPFGMDVVDVRPSTQGLRARPLEPDELETFAALREDEGRHLEGQEPEGAEAIECQLVYRIGKIAGDGWLLHAESPEDKWDIFRWGDRFFFRRSWTGQLAMVADFAHGGDELCVHMVHLAPEAFGDPDFGVEVVDFLIRRYILGQELPHPVPVEHAHDLAELGLWSYLMFGRAALYARLPNPGP